MNHDNFSSLNNNTDDGFVPIADPSFRKENTISQNIQNENSNEKKVAATDINKHDNDNVEIGHRSVTIRLKDLHNFLKEFMIESDHDSKENTLQKRSIDQRAFITDLLFNENFINRVKKFTEKYIFQAASGSAFNNVIPSAGRVFFFKGKSC